MELIWIRGRDLVDVAVQLAEPVAGCKYLGRWDLRWNRNVEATLRDAPEQEAGSWIGADRHLGVADVGIKVAQTRQPCSQRTVGVVA